MSRRVAAVAVLVFVHALAVLGAPALGSPDRTASLDIDLVASGVSVAGATIELSTSPPQPGMLANATSRWISIPCNNSGRCVSNDVPGNTYFVAVRTAGATAALEKPIVLRTGTAYHAVLRVDATGVVEIESIGVIRVTPTGTLLTQGAAPSAELDAQNLSERGDQDVASSVARLSGVTLNRPAGASVGLPVSAILRGDDPKEAVVELDGSPINNGNTGDFDLSLLDPSAFQNVQVVYGLAPASLVGANIEGGILNFHTLDPTAVPQGIARYTTGGFDTNAFTVATTGSADKLGYAFEARSLYQLGQVNAYPVLDVGTGQEATLGSAISSTNALAKLTYALPRDGTIQASVLTFGVNEDVSAPLSSPVDPADQGPGAPFYSYEGSERSNVTTFYHFNARVGVGSSGEAGSAPALVSAGFLAVNARQTVTGPAYSYNSYFLDTTDLLDNYSLEYDRPLRNTDFTLVALGQTEHLSVNWQDAAADAAGEAVVARPLASAVATPPPPPFAIPATPPAPTQSQTNRTFLARYLWDGGAHLEYTAAAYLSTFSTFGSSFNPRGAVVWRPTQQSLIRASIGTGFQAPALADKIVPVPLPPPDPDSGLISIGNPDLSADHTLQYELDFEHAFSLSQYALNAELDLYHVNQASDDITYIPAGAAPSTPMYSYPINTSNTVWQGLVVQLEQPLRDGLGLAASYNINQGYPLALPPALVGSSGNLVPGQQFQNVPLHRATFAVQQQRRRFVWRAGLAYEGTNNDLNQPPFATVNADVSYTVDNTTFLLAGNNLTGVYAGNFQLAGAGVPYPGLSGLIPTNAYQLRAPNVMASLTQHW